ncbi:transcriptional regulator [Streptomyces sp. NPDC057654]|uniref:transcriptional regulator n=1 Tax=Streptomyces sp. NPDC057654 TaxID=3346196 RepID=UPI0036B062F9
MAELTVYASESAVPEAAGQREAVRRARVVLVHPVSGVPVVDEHLRVELPAPAPWPRLADVLLGEGEGDRSAERLAACHPGALVVAVYRDHECWIRFADGGCALTLDAQRSAARSSWAVWASLAHAWLVSGLPVAEFASAPVRLVLGHSPARPSNCPRSVRAASASAERERPAAS